MKATAEKKHLQSMTHALIVSTITIK